MNKRHEQLLFLLLTSSFDLMKCSFYKKLTTIIMFGLVVLLSLLPFYGLCQTDWELEEVEGPLKVYTRLKEGTTYLETKVAGKGDADLSAIIAVMQDADNYTKFMPSCIESSKRNMKGDTIQVHTVITEAPWPVSNREGTYEFKYKYYPDSNQVIVKFKAIVNSMPTLGCVQVEDAEGYWKFVELNKNEIYVEYVIYANPGGSIPSWLSNMSVIDLPLGTVIGAFYRTKLPEYKEKKVSFLN